MSFPNNIMNRPQVWTHPQINTRLELLNKVYNRPKVSGIIATIVEFVRSTFYKLKFLICFRNEENAYKFLMGLRPRLKHDQGYLFHLRNFNLIAPRFQNRFQIKQINTCKKPDPKPFIPQTSKTPQNPGHPYIPANNPGHTPLIPAHLPSSNGAHPLPTVKLAPVHVPQPQNPLHTYMPANTQKHHIVITPTLAPMTNVVHTLPAQLPPVHVAPQQSSLHQYMPANANKPVVVQTPSPVNHVNHAVPVQPATVHVSPQQGPKHQYMPANNHNVVLQASTPVQHVNHNSPVQHAPVHVSPQKPIVYMEKKPKDKPEVKVDRTLNVNTEKKVKPQTEVKVERTLNVKTASPVTLPKPQTEVKVERNINVKPASRVERENVVRQAPLQIVNANQNANLPVHGFKSRT